MNAWPLIRTVFTLTISLTASQAWVSPAVAQNRVGDRFVVATWNLEWFYDDNQNDNYQQLAKEQSAPSLEDWQWKRDTVAAAIAKMRPDILALQEVENQRVLYYLVQRLRSNHNQSYRIAFVEGNDYYTEQDVGILYRQDLFEVGRWEATRQEYDDQQLYSVNKHQFAKFLVGPADNRTVLTLVNLHFRARAEQAPRRVRQARQLNRWLNTLPKSQSEQLIVLGDFNTEHRHGAQTSEPTEVAELVRRGNTDATDDLVDLHRWVSAANRSTHLTGGQFDRMLASLALTKDEPGSTDLVLEKVEVGKNLVVRGTQDRAHWEESPFWKIPQQERDISDHYPVIATFRFK